MFLLWGLTSWDYTLGSSFAQLFPKDQQYEDGKGVFQISAPTQLLLQEIISPPAQLPYIIISVSSADSRGGKLPILTSNVKCCESLFFLIRKAEMQVGQSWSFQSHLKDLWTQIPFTFDKNHISKPLSQLWTNSSLHSRTMNAYSCSAENKHVMNTPEINLFPIVMS